MSAQTYIPTGLSTKNTKSFSNGIDSLLTDLEDMIKNYQRVYFNLVGGFKGIQAYLNTIGMFYADEIIYIFEGSNAELITIPRLPIKIDYEAIKPYRVQLALMSQGAILPLDQVSPIMASLIYQENQEVILSNWGNLIWNKAKIELLTHDLLPFPRLEYTSKFREDYNNIRNPHEQVKLQEVLAKVSSLLIQSNGDIACLRQDGGLLYEVYTNNKKGIAHFRVTQGLRISCSLVAGTLRLHRYGTEPDVNKNPI